MANQLRPSKSQSFEGLQKLAEHNRAKSNPGKPACKRDGFRDVLTRNELESYTNHFSLPETSICQLVKQPHSSRFSWVSTKRLHILDLSRNNIKAIEGLRELTRLRVLNLRLSNCTLIEELYLAGNKISDVEGLHRLLKLTVLDLSFNKIITTKALGQLVANYNSLIALNLLGNPIQGNQSDIQLRKAVCSLLPKLAHLNKQPMNQQKAREVGMDIVVKASLGSSSASYRRTVKKVTQGGGSLSSIAVRSNANVGQRSRKKLKSRSHRQFVVKPRSSVQV
ncbi:hypothetical protein Ancab_036388 [Ancistrocladus abbreviatus]